MMAVHPAEDIPRQVSQSKNDVLDFSELLGRVEKTQKEHSKKLDRHTQQLDQIQAVLREQSSDIDVLRLAQGNQSDTLDVIQAVQSAHSERLDELRGSVSEILALLRNGGGSTAN